MSGYDPVNRNPESSAEGRQRRCRRNIRWQAVPYLRAATYNARLNEAVAAGRVKSSATWKVGNISELAKVRWCTAVEHIAHQDSNFGPDALRNTQPVEADECVRDIVGTTQVENQPRGCVKD